MFFLMLDQPDLGSYLLFVVCLPPALWGWWRPKGLKPERYLGCMLRLFLVKSVFRVSSLIFFGFRHEECRPVVCFTGCPSCRT